MKKDNKQSIAKIIVCLVLRIVIFLIILFLHYQLLILMLNIFNCRFNIKSPNDRFVDISIALALLKYFVLFYFMFFILIYIIKVNIKNRCGIYLIDTVFVTFTFSLSFFIYIISVDAAKTINVLETRDLKIYYIPNLLVTLIPFIVMITNESSLKYFYDYYFSQIVIILKCFYSKIMKFCDN